MSDVLASAVAKLSIATGHAMQIYNCLNCPLRHWTSVCQGWPTVKLAPMHALNQHVSIIRA